MKRLLLVFLFSLLFSCQSEQDNVVRNYEDSLTSSSPLISLMSRVCQNPTACDNVLDDSSCFSIKLPVSIVLNGQELYVGSISDFEIITSIKAQSNTDDDIVHFTFPITIVYADSQETVVNTQQQFDAISNTCVPAVFHEITCMRFNFPFVINTYNTVSQMANSFTITSNPQLYSFLHDLSANDLISIAYPITVTDFGGLTIAVGDNTQLENVISAAIQDCQIYTTNPEDLLEILTNGSWYVSYYFNYWDETANYDGYDFAFLSDGTFTAIKNNQIVNGEWELQTDNGYQRLEFDFDGPAFQELECDWRIIEFSGSDIHLSNENGGGSGGPGDRDGNNGNYYLYLTKN